MISGRIGCELVVLAAFCVLAIFLFPAVQGPYPAVNGPVTALQAARAAIRLRILIMQGAFRALGNLLIAPAVFSWIWLPQVKSRSGSSFDCTTILRC